MRHRVLTGWSLALLFPLACTGGTVEDDPPADGGAGSTSSSHAVAGASSSASGSSLVASAAGGTSSVGLPSSAALATSQAVPSSAAAASSWNPPSSTGTASSAAAVSSSGPGVVRGCTFPQGVPEGDFTGSTEVNATVAAAVNTVMSDLSGCNVGSDCVLGSTWPDAQSWFDAVNAVLRGLGYCAGQHEVNYTDEIAVSDTGCTGRWYGYHIYNYGGGKVVWNPGAQRGSWTITSNWCP